MPSLIICRTASGSRVPEPSGESIFADLHKLQIPTGKKTLIPPPAFPNAFMFRSFLPG
jgi:hypothetical protein